MNLNKINLTDVPNIPIGTLSKLAPEQLLSLQQQAAQHLQRAKMLKDWLDNSVALKYRDIAANIRRLDSKDTGTVHFSDGDFKVTSVLTKKVEWNQDRLKDVVSAIRKHGDNVDEYVDTSYKISETKYSAWPEHIKNIFKPARVLKTGGETFKIQPLSDGGRDE
ncbi:MAG: hypothetical protein KGQ36_04900 [Rickettsiales bacterium]|nr:hypothetical protein [Rickettsiales bacterium]